MHAQVPVKNVSKKTKKTERGTHKWCGPTPPPAADRPSFSFFSSITVATRGRIVCKATNRFFVLSRQISTERHTPPLGDSVIRWQKLTKNISWLFFRIFSYSKWKFFDLWWFCQIIRCWMLQSQLLSGLKGVGHVTFSQSGSDCPLTACPLTGSRRGIKLLFVVFSICIFFLFGSHGFWQVSCLVCGIALRVTEIDPHYQ